MAFEKFSIKDPKFVKISALQVIISTILFTVIIFILGEIQPGYNQITNTISEIGGGSGEVKFIFQITAILFGFSVIVFALGLHNGIENGNGSIKAPVLIIISGIALMGVVLFLPEDVGNYHQATSLTIVRILHLTFASLAISSAGFTPFFLYHRFKVSSVWEKYSSLTIIAGILSNLPSVIIAIGLITSTLQGYIGILEKLTVFVPICWLVFIASQIVYNSRKLLS